MIGAMYASDKKIVDIYKDKCTLAEHTESAVSQEDVLSYIEMVSINRKNTMNIKVFQFKKVS